MAETAKKQTSPNPSQPDSRHKRLELLVGTWKTEGQTVASAGAPSEKIHSSDIYEWLPGEFFLIHRWDGHIGSKAIKGLEILGYDPERDRYITRFFDNEGNTSEETLTIRDDVWTWKGENIRCTATVSEDGKTMTARHERSDDGNNWQPWMEVTLRKVT
jgi:hypothetical protein